MTRPVIHGTATGLPDTGIIPITPVGADLGVAGTFELQRLGPFCFLTGVNVTVPNGVVLPRIFYLRTPGFVPSPNRGFGWPAEITRTGTHRGTAHMWGDYVVLNGSLGGLTAGTFAMNWVTRDAFPSPP